MMHMRRSKRLLGAIANLLACFAFSCAFAFCQPGQIPGSSGGGGTTVTNTPSGTGQVLMSTGATTSAWTPTPNITGPITVGNAGNAGTVDFFCGTATSQGSGAITYMAPASCTPYTFIPASAASTGIPHYSNSANVITETISPVSLTADVSGALPPSSGGVAQVQTTNVGGLWTPFFNIPYNATGEVPCYSTSLPCIVGITVPVTMNLTRVTMPVNVGVSAATCDVGWYSSTGTRLTYTNAGLSAATSSSVPIASYSPQVTLTPGLYYFAFTCSSLTVQGLSSAIFSSGLLMNAAEFSNTVALIGVGSTSVSGGALPSTLGTITPYSLGSNYIYPPITISVP